MRVGVRSLKLAFGLSGRHKNARILWAVLARGRRFDADHVPVKPEGSAMTVPAIAA